MSTEFEREYKILELRLFDEFDKKVLDVILPQETETRSEYREYLKEKINNYLTNAAAEPLERILKYVRKKLVINTLTIALVIE